MRYSLVTETFPPEVNGVAMTLHRLATGLADRNHEVQVVRPRQKADAEDPADGDPFTTELVQGLPIPRYSGLLFGLPSGGKLRKLWKAARPDMVHVATEGPLGWSAVRTARTLRIPVVSSFHTNFHAYTRHYGVGPVQKAALAYLKWIHNRTTRTFVPSEDLRDQLEGGGFRNLDILGRGVDTELFSPEHRSTELRESWKVGAYESVVIYVGRLAAEKNIALSVRAFRKMQDSGLNAKMVVVGDGPAREKLAAENPDIIFAGVKRGEDLARHYASADAFLFASETETFGNVVTEGMASGLVVLAYNYAAAQKYIQSGENGVTVALGEQRPFLDAAGALAESPEKWDDMRKKARQTALGLSWDAIFDRYEQTICNLAASSEQSSRLS